MLLKWTVKRFELQFQKCYEKIGICIKPSVLYMQSVPINTNVMSSNLAQAIQHYVINFASDLWQVRGFKHKFIIINFFFNHYPFWDLFWINSPFKDMKYQLCYLKRCLYTQIIHLFINTSFFLQKKKNNKFMFVINNPKRRYLWLFSKLFQQKIFFICMI
jgi:hypothetical protein